MGWTASGMAQDWLLLEDPILWTILQINISSNNHVGYNVALATIKHLSHIPLLIQKDKSMDKADIMVGYRLLSHGFESHPRPKEVSFFTWPI